MKIKPAYLLVAILSIATLYFYQDPQSNGNSRLALTRAIVEHGNFQIETYQDQPDWRTLDKAFYGGHYYTTKGIGSSLLAVPAYFLLYKLATLLGFALGNTFIKHFLTLLVVGVAFVVNGWVLYLIAHSITRNIWKAMLAALAVSLGTMLWPYSAVYYAHVPAALFAGVAFYLLLRMRLAPETVSMKKLGLAGAAMGLAFITDYTTALIIAGLIVYALYVMRGKSRTAILVAAMAGALGALLPLTLMFVYNKLVYGNPIAFGYSYTADPLFHQGRTAGFMGISLPDLAAFYHITIDPQFGLFWQSPVLLLAIVGYVVAFKSGIFRFEAILSICVFVSMALLNSGTFMWWGGSAFGPRYLIVALPFFIIPLALIPDRITWLLGGLTALSAGQMLIPLLGKIQIGLDYNATTDRFSVNQPFNGFSILYQYGIPIILKLHRKETLPWTLGSSIGLAYRYSAAALVLVEGLLVGLLYKVTRMDRPGNGREFLDKHGSA